MERTFLMIKPDGVQRGLIGEIVSRIEKKGLKITALKMIQVSQEKAREHYAEHADKPFFQSLIDYITSGPVVAMVVEGRNAISVVRKMVGKTDPTEAEAGTMRGDMAMDIGRNVVHASDSLRSAEREIGIFFSEDEIVEYRRFDEVWVYEQ